MKTRFTLLYLLIPLFAFAQYSPVDDFYYEHKDRNNSFSINIGNFLLTAGSWFVEEPGIKNLVRNSRRAKILLSEEENFVSKSEINQFLKEIKRDGFESLAYVRSDESRIQIYAREEKGFIRNILVLINQPIEFAMVSLDCKFLMEDVQELLHEL